jgi:hypothetical protein
MGLSHSWVAYLFKGEIERPLMNIVIRPPKDMAMVI